MLLTISYKRGKVRRKLVFRSDGWVRSLVTHTYLKLTSHYSLKISLYQTQLYLCFGFAFSHSSDFPAININIQILTKSGMGQQLSSDIIIQD